MDTLISKLGRVIVRGQLKKLELISIASADTLAGSTNFVFWEDSIPVHNESVDVIGIWKNNNL